MYFDKYVGYANTEMGKAITAFRLEFVLKYAGSNVSVCDVGIGCGDFLDAMRRFVLRAVGYDVNDAALDWLAERRLYADPYISRVDVMTFWDSLEHIPNFDLILQNCMQWAFISMPIYLDLHDDVLSSKHYRKDEHFWYFTHIGLVETMYQLGFSFVASSNKERELGREAITTFAFRRRVE